MVNPIKTIPHKIACIYKAGEKTASTQRASGTIKKPKTKIKNTAGPSALSFFDKSKSQILHLFFKDKLKKDGYKSPFWHWGHLHWTPCQNVLRNSSNASNVLHALRLGCPTSKQKQIRTAKQHLQNANTMRPLQSQNDCLL